MSTLIPITKIAGRPIPLRGNDIDTDRIIPARYMKAITFDGMGQFAFHDARFDANGKSLGHVMDDPRYQAKGPRIAIVNKNFGCGSSREHAPQALLRWGVKAIVGESFADIFFGNCVALGIPCVTASAADVAALMGAVEADPAHDLTIDLTAMTATYYSVIYPVSLPDGARKQLLEGTWDATRTLLDAAEQTRATAARLPYVGGFK
ncbi:MAG TPA: 3-isopropylmalate dehydratase small subunit [Candidatus Binatia bacterium]|nr:3-isopropylmalate dehydratase small subunit [Candidatus Binatia bacterium]